MQDTDKTVEKLTKVVVWQQKGLLAFQLSWEHSLLTTRVTFKQCYISEGKISLFILVLHLIVIPLTSIGEVKCKEFNSEKRNTCWIHLGDEGVQIKRTSWTNSLGFFSWKTGICQGFSALDADLVTQSPHSQRIAVHSCSRQCTLHLGWQAEKSCTKWRL